MKINLRTSGVKQKTPKQQQKPTPLPLNNYKNKGMLRLCQGHDAKGITVSSFLFPGSRHGIILILAVNA